jgi:ribosomal protein L37E
MAGVVNTCNRCGTNVYDMEPHTCSKRGQPMGGSLEWASEMEDRRREAEKRKAAEQQPVPLVELAEADPLRLLANGKYAAFDGMTWPAAGEPTADLVYRLRYAKGLTDSDRLVAASIVDAYLELVRCPREKREAVVRRLREAYRMEVRNEVPTTP